MSPTGISWADVVCNPLRGCSPVSPGCAHCWAVDMAERLHNFGQPGFGQLVQIGDGDRPTKWARVSSSTPAYAQTTPHTDDPLGQLDGLVRRRKAARVFLGSMTDIFWSGHTDRARMAVMAAILLTADAVQVLTLTKRPLEALAFFERWLSMPDALDAAWLALHEAIGPLSAEQFSRARERFEAMSPHPVPCRCERCASARPREVGRFGVTEGYRGGQPRLPDNWWFGVSVENEAETRRLHTLRMVNARVRWVSAEPLLEPWDPTPHAEVIDWIVLGGESGKRARPCDVNGIARMAEQAERAGIVVHMKQLGSRPQLDGEPLKLRHQMGGRQGEWPPWVPRTREWPR